MLVQALKSRTIWFAIALAVLSILQGYVGLLPLSQVGQMVVGIVIAVIITILRFITTTPVVNK
jgi:ABC-type branched-subunit amino acid transport system permease subunit